MEVSYNGKITTISGLELFSFEKIFDCGQCFRFEKDEDGVYTGVAYKKLFRGFQTSPSQIGIYCTPEDFERLWKHFLALDVDYKRINESLPKDAALSNALKHGEGIRILSQEPWEAICSFIISQNNNIPRIKKNIASLCEKYGARLEAEVSSEPCRYAFPSAKDIAEKASVASLRELKLGFRAEYIMDAAEKISSNEISLDRIKALPSEKAIEELCKIKGIGPKVASCSLLFGFEKYDVFPIDVWVKRILEKYYKEKDFSASHPDEIKEYFGDFAGIAQQYLFYNERWIESNTKDSYHSA